MYDPFENDGVINYTTGEIIVLMVYQDTVQFMMKFARLRNWDTTGSWISIKTVILPSYCICKALDSKGKYTTFVDGVFDSLYDNDKSVNSAVQQSANGSYRLVEMLARPAMVI